MRGDPFKMNAKFPGKCAGRNPDGTPCGRDVKRGDSVFYYPREKRAYRFGCQCGAAERAEREFQAAAFDGVTYWVR